ncbi:Aste57867_16928 [Aphanomyces stellatus]|uniref:Aste57867_16928 protein n=1 Tax=Aphanomyces stellatus TaxID=120398 RepID=A0A485L6K4_9STRA|nr:hypothetical protein As57867_016870 [Aphanomyces stellatus]VFT93690.1 Aste57867_16928 [Aphanomyces stellatus]
MELDVTCLPYHVQVYGEESARTVEYVGRANHPADAVCVRSLRPLHLTPLAAPVPRATSSTSPLEAALSGTFCAFPPIETESSYFEIRIEHVLRPKHKVSIGVCAAQHPPTTELGSSSHSIALACASGNILVNGVSIEKCAIKAMPGDIVGCGLVRHTLFFTFNGAVVATFAHWNGEYAPYGAIGLHGIGEKVQLMASPAAWTFDICAYMSTFDGILTPQTSLPPSTTLLEQMDHLVADYLYTMGYSGAAAALVSSASEETTTVSSLPQYMRQCIKRRQSAHIFEHVPRDNLPPTLRCHVDCLVFLDCLRDEQGNFSHVDAAIQFAHTHLAEYVTDVTLCHVVRQVLATLAYGAAGAFPNQAVVDKRFREHVLEELLAWAAETSETKRNHASSPSGTATKLEAWLARIALQKQGDMPWKYGAGLVGPIDQSDILVQEDEESESGL